MRCAVLLTEDAARDLEEIYNYISEHDLPSRAEYVLKPGLQRCLHDGCLGRDRQPSAVPELDDD